MLVGKGRGIGLVIAFGFALSGYAAAGPRAEIKVLQGLPTLHINGRPFPPFAYMSYLGETRFYREAAESGIHLYCFPAYLGDRGINPNSGIGPFRAAIWRGENRYDYSSIEDDFEKILKADSQAEVIIRICLDVPQWWEEKYPQEAALRSDGTAVRQCFSSELWRQQAGEALRNCIRWLLTSTYAEHLAGIHVAAGFTEEWFYHFSGNFSDGSPRRISSFRRWLRNQYQNNLASLRKAWCNDEITFEEVVPADISGADRRKVWRTPEKDRAVLDTLRFHTETMADNVAYFCRIVKESSDRSLLAGAFYGYHFFVTDPRRGHGALAKLLECPDLDYLSSPNVYRRVMGEDWPPMAAVQSVQLHGKLWMAENDTRTSLTTLLKDRAPEICPAGQYESKVWQGPPDIESSTAFLWKNAARMLSYGYGGWWFDMWGGWFSDPALLHVLETTVELYNRYPPDDPHEMACQVCVLTDEELQFLDGSFGALTEKILSNRYALGKTGTPYHLYLRSDFNRIPAAGYKVIWLLGLPDLTEAEVRAVRMWQASGVTVLKTGPEGTTIYHHPDQSAFYPDRYTWSASELRQIWRESGVHLYVESDDVVYAGYGWLSLHTLTGGNRLIHFPFAATVIDPLSGTTLADSVRSFQVHINPRSTILFRIEPSQK